MFFLMLFILLSQLKVFTGKGFSCLLFLFYLFLVPIITTVKISFFLFSKITRIHIRC